jgi:hypothetical protein
MGLLAGALFGLPGVIVVAANSFTRATTGHHLYESLNIPDSTPKK